MFTVGDSTTDDRAALGYPGMDSHRAIETSMQTESTVWALQMINYTKFTSAPLLMALVLVGMIQTIPTAAQSNQPSVKASTPSLLIGIIINTQAHQR
jgi:hypothetical protein